MTYLGKDKDQREAIEVKPKSPSLVDELEEGMKETIKEVGKMFDAIPVDDNFLGDLADHNVVCDVVFCLILDLAFILLQRLHYDYYSFE